jgi:hypothetical protein
MSIKYFINNLPKPIFKNILLYKFVLEVILEKIIL